jgi:hypothetical protein
MPDDFNRSASILSISAKLQGNTKDRNGASLLHAPNFAVWCTSDIRYKKLRKSRQGPFLIQRCIMQDIRSQFCF